MDFFKIRDLKKFYVLILVGVLIDFTGCAPRENTTTVNTNVNSNPVNTTVNTNSVKPPENKQATMAMPVTLPVLDAMFTDEQFAAELKSKLQLTDEQINRLKEVSGSAVRDLNEDDSEDNVGSTRASSERAGNEIRQIIGEDKANQHALAGWRGKCRQQFDRRGSGCGADRHANRRQCARLPDGRFSKRKAR
jgi:hypothetical protein